MQRRYFSVSCPLFIQLKPITVKFGDKIITKMVIDKPSSAPMVYPKMIKMLQEFELPNDSVTDRSEALARAQKAVQQGKYPV